MAQAILSVHMDEDTKRAFADFCEQVGMSVSTAINVFARQTLRERRLPFAISLDASDATMSPETKVLDRRVLEEAVAKAASAFSAIEQVILFGSYARGDARSDSDIDLRLVRVPGGVFSMMNLAAFSEAVREQTGKQVDVVSARVLTDAQLVEAIEREGVVVYERQER